MDSKRFVSVCERAYGYSLQKDVLLSYEGHVIRFELNEFDGLLVISKNKKLQCSANPGKIHNHVLWLEEDNIKKAAEIFIEYEKEQINKSLKSIDRRNNVISMLERIES